MAAWGCGSSVATMHVRNWLVAGAALGLGGTVSAALIVFANPARDEVGVYAVAHDLPAGAAITADALRVVSVLLPDGSSSLFSTADASELRSTRAAHDLIAGQLLQRGDVVSGGPAPDVRLVFIPVKDGPPAAPGSRLDLLVISGTPDHPSVVPFALGVEVRAVATGGFVVAVSSRQAPAFVYAAENMRLVAVVAAPGAGTGNEAPVDDQDQAITVASQP